MLLLVLVLLHAPEGRELVVNSALVTTMRSADGKGNKYIAGDARCLIHTSDGKFVSVIESCDEVRELFTQR
jgi:hypothetical protein